MKQQTGEVVDSTEIESPCEQGFWPVSNFKLDFVKNMKKYLERIYQIDHSVSGHYKCLKLSSSFTWDLELENIFPRLFQNSTCLTSSPLYHYLKALQSLSLSADCFWLDFVLLDVQVEGSNRRLAGSLT